MVVRFQAGPWKYCQQLTRVAPVQTAFARLFALGLGGSSDINQFWYAWGFYIHIHTILLVKNTECT